jgi:molybdenum cofactor guanylyltransferase
VMDRENGLKAAASNNSQPSVLGVILAGGKSSRMGENKALLKINGVRFIDHMSSILFSVRPKLKGVIVSGSVPGTSFIPDFYKDLGPLGGIASVIEHLNNDFFTHLLLVPVDMPFLNPQILNPLITELKRMKLIQAIRYRDYELPLLLNISSSLLHFLKIAIDDPKRRSIRWLLNQLNATELSLNPEHGKKFTNLNYRSEYESAIF